MKFSSILFFLGDDSFGVHVYTTVDRDLCLPFKGKPLPFSLTPIALFMRRERLENTVKSSTFLSLLEESLTVDMCQNHTDKALSRFNFHTLTTNLHY